MTSSQREHLFVPAMIGLVAAIFTALSILCLPVSLAVASNFLIAFTAMCIGVWVAWRKGLNSYELLTFGVRTMVCTMASTVATAMFFARGHIPFKGNELEAWLAVGPLFGPLLAVFVPLAISAFDAHYPGRLRFWLEPSKEASRHYLEQLIKEASHQEDIAKYHLDGARQHRKNLEQRLADFESQDQHLPVQP